MSREKNWQDIKYMQTINGRIFLDEMRRKNIPLEIYFDITNRCNLNCRHCWFVQNEDKELTQDKIKDIFSQLADTGCLNLILTGGEPLVREEFLELANFAKDKGFNLSFLSNGTLITENNIGKIKDLEFEEVQISLYSLEAAIHDRITTVPGSFERTMEAINLLSQHKIRFTIATIAMKYNVSSLKELIHEGRERNWDIRTDFIIYPKRNGSLTPLECRVTNEQLDYAIDNKLFVGRKFHGDFADTIGMCVYNIGRIHVSISPSGRVFPSTGLRIEVGDLERDSFKDIWFNSERLRGLRSLKINDFECSHCHYVNVCCWMPDLALLEHGNLTAAPKECCRITRRFI